MAKRKPDSVAVRMMEVDFVKRGESFTPKRIALAMGIPRNHATSAISALHDRGEIMKAGEGRYCKPVRHPIHTRRLTCPDTLYS